MKIPLAALPYSQHTPEIIAALRRLDADPKANVDLQVRCLLADMGWIVSKRVCELTTEGRRVLAEQTGETR